MPMPAGSRPAPGGTTFLPGYQTVMDEGGQWWYVPVAAAEAQAAAEGVRPVPRTGGAQRAAAYATEPPPAVEPGAYRAVGGQRWETTNQPGAFSTVGPISYTPGPGGVAGQRWTTTNQPGAFSTMGPISYQPGPGRRSLEERFRALVAAGRIDPANIADPVTGAIRPDVWALLDEQGPGYRFGAGELEPGPGGAEGFEFMNPSEIAAAQWQQTHLAQQREREAALSGMYQDPRTGQYNVTTAYGNQLLDRFANARANEQRYRQQLEQGLEATSTGQAQLERAYASQNPVAVRQAQEAYNRARGLTRNVERPISLEELGRGMTEQQWGAAGQATRAGYGDEEWEELLRGQGGPPRSARYAPAYAYRRAAAGRATGY